jgi:two-component system KDP operon response regulator KdpE
VAPLGPSQTEGRSEGERPLSCGVRPKTGLTLLVPDSTLDLSAVVLALRGKGLRPVVAPLSENVFHIIANWRPRATIVQGGVPQWQDVLRFLGEREIPTVVIGSPQQLRRAEELGAVSVGIVSPAEPAEVADAAELIIGPLSSTGVPDSIDLGHVYIDVRARRVLIEGEEVRLPPKEFHILVQLAMQPGEPVSSPELIRKLWPATATTTADDLHCRVSRLRGFIGDRKRAEPLVSNRRGFGYVLNISEIKVD